MDRISALRNVEEALSEFEEGNVELAELEARVGSILRTYATDFGDGTATYRVAAEDRERPVVVVAESPGQARERAGEVAPITPAGVERLTDPPDS
jgi:L-aminopeptidase/D-esterase-like protein